MVRAYCPVCRCYVGWADNQDDYECGLCRLDYLTTLVNSVRYWARFDLPKGGNMYPYEAIFKNDGNDETPMLVLLPNSVIRLVTAMLADGVTLHVNGNPVILSNEEMGIIESGLRALSEAI